MICLTVRLLWTAAGTEIGFSFLGQQWKQATLGWFVDTRPATAKLPTEQADFWLAEIERVLADAADEKPARRAELAMGAALVLDGHVQRYAERRQFYSHTSMPLNPGSRSGFPLVYDSEVQREAFEEKVAAARMKYARQATELDPDNVAWWQLRAGAFLEGFSNGNSMLARSSSRMRTA